VNLQNLEQRRRGVSVPIVAGLLGLVALAGGCGVYSTSSGRVDESLRWVNVPYLENATAEPNIEIELTEAIITALQDDNTLKVVDLEAARTELVGRVVGYKLREAFTTATGGNMQVDEYQVQIAVELTMRRLDGGENVFTRKRLNGSGNFILGDSATSELTARSEAAAEIVREVLGLIVEDW
jgi:hypothetical protein